MDRQETNEFFSGLLKTFQSCATGPMIPYDPNQLPHPLPGCTLVPDSNHHIAADFDKDGDVDMNDFGVFQRCYSGTGRPLNQHCAD